MRDPSGMNGTEWPGIKAISKPKVLRNPVPSESRLPGLSGVNRDMPTEKPIAQSVRAASLKSAGQTLAQSGMFNFNGGQSIRTYNTRNARYQFGKILKRTIGSAAGVDKLTRDILGNVTSNGKLYKKDVKKVLRNLPSSQANRIMGHLGM